MADPAPLTALDQFLMPARMAPYLRACTGNEGQARRLYVWNIEISAAFWGPISGIEIAVRNAVHSSLVEHFDQQDWWNSPRVDQWLVASARDVESELSRRYARHHREPKPDDVVAGLSFGFWVTALATPKNGLEQNKYWHRCLHQAFPGWLHKPNDLKNRKAFARKIEHIRKFRNRVAHHEPIHERNLAEDHDRLITMARLIHPELALFIEQHSRVPAVLGVLVRKLSPAANERLPDDGRTGGGA